MSKGPLHLSELISSTGEHDAEQMKLQAIVPPKRCAAIVASGPNKGKQCTNVAADNGFCKSYHKDYKGPKGTLTMEDIIIPPIKEIVVNKQDNEIAAEVNEIKAFLDGTIDDDHNEEEESSEHEDSTDEAGYDSDDYDIPPPASHVAKITPPNSRAESPILNMMNDQKQSVHFAPAPVYYPDSDDDAPSDDEHYDKHKTKIKSMMETTAHDLPKFKPIMPPLPELEEGQEPAPIDPQKADDEYTTQLINQTMFCVITQECYYKAIEMGCAAVCTSKYKSGDVEGMTLYGLDEVIRDDKLIAKNFPTMVRDMCEDLGLPLYKLKSYHLFAMYNAYLFMTHNGIADAKRDLKKKQFRYKIN